MDREYTIPIKFGPNGCQVNVGDELCQETQTLEIIKEFNRVYQSKLQEISGIGGGDNLQLKVNLQQNWIRDLTQQNEMLVKIVEALEKEAADKVSLLKKKLETSSISSEKKLHLLENDVGSLVEVIKRARDDKKWSVNGLKFFTVNPESFMAKSECTCKCALIPPAVTSESVVATSRAQENISLKLSESLHRRIKRSNDSKLRVILEAHKNMTELDDKVKDLERRLSESPKEGDLESLNHKLLLKEEEINSVKRPKTLEKSTSVVVEIIEGTTEIAELWQIITKLRDEVATYVEKCDNLTNESKAKDETIRNLNNDLKNLEVRYDKATNEVECKDSVIKELRNRIQHMEETVTDLEKVKISGKQSRNAVREKTPHPSSIAKPSLKVPSRSRVTWRNKTPASGTQTASTRISKVPIMKQSMKMKSIGESKIVQTKRHPLRSVTKSMTTTKSRSALKSSKWSGDLQKSRVETLARSTGISKVPIPKQLMKMKSIGESKIVQTKRHPSRSVYVDTKSLTTTKSKRGSSRNAPKSSKRSGGSRKLARSKSGSSSKSDTLPESLSLSVGTQDNVERISAQTTTQKQRKPLISSSPRPRSPTYSNIYDIPLTPTKSKRGSSRNASKSEDSRKLARSKSGSSSKSDTSPESLSLSVGTQGNVERISAQTTTRKQRKPLISSSPRPRSPTYSNLYDIPLTPRDLSPPSPKPFEPEVCSTRRRTSLHENQNCQKRPCTPHWHMVIPNEPSPIATRSIDAEEDSAQLRKMLRQLEDENRTLKDTIFQANRELELFYEQANTYVTEREDYKRRFNDSQLALTKLQGEFSTAQSHWQSDTSEAENALEKLKKENLKMKEQVKNVRRQSESMNQAQNETIQALQDALREKEGVQKGVKGVPPSASFSPSQKSGKSVTVSESVASGSQSVSMKTDDAKSRETYLELNNMESGSILTPHDEFSPTSPATLEVEKLRAEREQEREEHEKEVSSLKNAILTPHDEFSPTGSATLEVEKLRAEREQEREEHEKEVSSLKNAILTPHDEFSPTCPATLEVEKLRAEREQEREEHDKEVSSLKDTIEELEKELEAAPSTLMRDKVGQAESECDAIRRLLNEAKELNKFYQNLPMDNLDGRVRDLQQRLCAKVCEMSEYAELLHETQEKLCWTVCQNNQLKKEIAQLLQHINDYEISYDANDERTDYCQKEVEMCRGNLTELRNKLLTMKDLLQKKVDQYSQLETEFCVQNNSLHCLRRQIDENKERYEKEVCDLRCTIGELQSKLTTTEEICKCLREDYERSKARAQNYTAHDAKVEEKLEESLQAANEEIATLNNYSAKLQKECACIRKQLQAKNKLIETAQAQIGGIKPGTIGSTEEEAMLLRDELDKALRKGDLLRAKNEALCLQLSEMQQAARQFKEHNMANEEHVKKCLCEIHHLRKVKDALDAKNQGYLEEIQYLRSAYKHLYEHFQMVTDALRSSKGKRCCSKTRLGGGQNVQSDSNLQRFSESTSDPSVNSNDTDELNGIQFGVKKGHGIADGLRMSSEFWQNRLSDDFLVSKDE